MDQVCSAFILFLYFFVVFTLQTTIASTVLSPFVHDYPGEQLAEETFTYSHLLWLLVIYQLSASTAIHNILPVQFID